MILSLRYLFFFSFRFLSFVSNFLFYISIWKTKHVLNSFNIFDWCFEAKMSLWLCVEQRECFEKTNDKISNSSLLFHTWIMVWCVLVVESLWCNNTQTLNSHQIQLECFRWWWQNVYKPLNFTAQSIDAHVSVFVCCDSVFVFVCGVSVGILIRLCRLHCNKLEWNRFSSKNRFSPSFRF